MQKFIYTLCLNIFTLILFFNNTAEAGVMEDANGLSCWNGDINYPFYTNGNAFGSVIDLRASRFIGEDTEILMISVISKDISFKENRAIDQHKIYLLENKMLGEVYYYIPKISNKWTLVVFDKRKNDVYYAIKATVGKI